MQSVTGSGRVVAGRYELLDPVGHGAMGTVWRARDLRLDREVAVKEVRVPGPMTYQDRNVLRERSLREARVAARLSHPGVVTVHDVIEADGTPWIIMELVPSRSLAQVLAEDGPLPPARAAMMGMTLLEALGSAHAAGVVHRDVKPGNILVTPEGRAVLTDFGIATLHGDPGLTQAGMVMGTPGFCAPERIRGEPASPASDLWSLGATLYAAVEGRGPFEGQGSAMAVLANIVHGDPPPAKSAGPLEPVITALMKRDPAARPDAITARRLLAAACAGYNGGARSGAQSASGAQAGSGPQGASGAQAGSGAQRFRAGRPVPWASSPLALAVSRAKPGPGARPDSAARSRSPPPRRKVSRPPPGNRRPRQSSRRRSPRRNLPRPHPATRVRAGRSSPGLGWPGPRWPEPAWPGPSFAATVAAQPSLRHDGGHRAGRGGARRDASAARHGRCLARRDAGAAGCRRRRACRRRAGCRGRAGSGGDRGGIGARCCSAVAERPWCWPPSWSRWALPTPHGSRRSGARPRAARSRPPGRSRPAITGTPRRPCPRRAGPGSRSRCPTAGGHGSTATPP